MDVAAETIAGATVTVTDESFKWDIETATRYLHSNGITDVRGFRIIRDDEAEVVVARVHTEGLKPRYVFRANEMPTRMTRNAYREFCKNYRGQNSRHLDAVENAAKGEEAENEGPTSK